MFFYSDDKSDGSKSKAPYDKWKANDRFLEHYNNMLFLDFVAKTSKDAREAAQARAEMIICQRKLEYWKRHPNYEQPIVTAGCEKLKRDWKVAA